MSPIRRECILSGATAGSPRHDWLTNSGGAIGLGLPVATGAAIGAPDRPVICLQADGSAMYTIQALWTQAREGLDVTTVILSNRSYAILNLELARVGAGAGGPRAESLLELTGPELDFVSLASGMGVSATRATHGRRTGRSAAARAAGAWPSPHRGHAARGSRMNMMPGRISGGPTNPSVRKICATTAESMSPPTTRGALPTSPGPRWIEDA